MPEAFFAYLPRRQTAIRPHNVIAFFFLCQMLFSIAYWTNTSGGMETLLYEKIIKIKKNV